MSIPTIPSSVSARGLISTSVSRFTTGTSGNTRLQMAFTRQQAPGSSREPCGRKRRKILQTKAETLHKRPTHWKDYQLHFSDGKQEAVPDVERIMRHRQ